MMAYGRGPTIVDAEAKTFSLSYTSPVVSA